MTNRRGNTSERIRQITKYLSEKAVYRYNEVSGKVEYKSKRMKEYSEVTGFNLNTICLKLAERNISCRPAQLAEILESTFTPSYNPFHEYINRLPKWDDEIDHIQELSKIVVVSNDPTWSLYFKKWFVAMVASLLDDSIINHTVLVLAGSQGVGKSTWLFNLVPDELKKYYYSGPISLRQKDTLILMAESMIINLEELAGLGKSGLSELKEIITKPQIRIRRPYGRFTEKLPHRASFVGSLNEKEFLTDLTGSRRFLCFDVESIDYLQEYNLDRVYAQAVALFNSGFAYWFSKSEISNLQKKNQIFRVKSLEEELLLMTYQPCENDARAEFLQTSEVLQRLHEKYDIKVDEAALHRLGKALKGNGFKQTTRRNRKVYILREVSPVEEQLTMSFKSN